MEFILKGIQDSLDADGEGWQAVAYVVVVGCERMVGHELESQAFRFIAPNQAYWITDGLLDAADCVMETSEDS